MDFGYMQIIDNKTIINAHFKDYFPHVSFILSAILGIVVVVGVIGNIFLVFAVFMTKDLNFEGNLFVVNLALCDAVISGFVTAMNIVGLLEAEIYFYDKVAFCKFIASTCITACTCALFNISFVGVNRYIFIVKNGLYRKIFTRRKCYIYCLLTWVVATLFHNLPTSLGWGGYTFDTKIMLCAYDRVKDLSFTIFISGFILSLPIMITAYCYMGIFLFWRKVTSKVSNMSNQSKSNQSNSMKLAKMLFILYFLFVLSWLPYGVVFISDRNNSYHELIHKLVVLLVHATSAINPILYAVLNQKFKEAYIDLLRKMFCLKKKIYFQSEYTKS